MQRQHRLIIYLSLEVLLTPPIWLILNGSVMYLIVYKLLYFLDLSVTLMLLLQPKFVWPILHHLEPSASKNFIAFPLFTLKNDLYIANCQFKLAVIYCHSVC